MNRRSVPTLSGLSRRTALGRVAAVGAALGLGGGLGRATAQEATTAHPLVGAWRFDFPEDPANLQLAAFHPDGTSTMLTGDVGTGIGAWKSTGDRTAETTHLHLDVDPRRNVNAPGTVTGVAAIEVDATGNTLTASNTVRVRTPDGAVVVEFAYTSTATRLAVEPVVPMGTPVVDPAFMTAIAGTPTTP